MQRLYFNDEILCKRSKTDFTQSSKEKIKRTREERDRDEERREEERREEATIVSQFTAFEEYCARDLFEEYCARDLFEEYCARDLFEAYCVRLVSIRKHVQTSKICQSTQFDDFRSFVERKEDETKRFAKLIILILIYETSSTFSMMMLRN